MRVLLLTVVPEFDLRLFQAPTGHDMRNIGSLAAPADPASGVKPRRSSLSLER